MNSVIYHQVGSRKWIKQVFSEQCDHKMLFSRGRCQGVMGHSGDHWMYSECGSYVTATNRENLKPHEIAGGTCPPGHANYVNPEEKISEWYLACNETSDVIDEELINKLENDEAMPENVSITRPVLEEDMDEAVYRDGRTLREALEDIENSRLEED